MTTIVKFCNAGTLYRRPDSIALHVRNPVGTNQSANAQTVLSRLEHARVYEKNNRSGYKHARAAVSQHQSSSEARYRLRRDAVETDMTASGTIATTGNPTHFPTPTWGGFALLTKANDNCGDKR